MMKSEKGFFKLEESLFTNILQDNTYPFFKPIRNLLVLATKKAELSILDLQEGSVVAQLTNPKVNDPLLAVDVSFSGDSLLCLHKTGLVTVWNIPEMKLTCYLTQLQNFKENLPISMQFFGSSERKFIVEMGDSKHLLCFVNTNLFNKALKYKLLTQALGEDSDMRITQFSFPNSSSPDKVAVCLSNSVILAEETFTNNSSTLSVVQQFFLCDNKNSFLDMSLNIGRSYKTSEYILVLRDLFGWYAQLAETDKKSAYQEIDKDSSISFVWTSQNYLCVITTNKEKTKLSFFRIIVGNGLWVGKVDEMVLERVEKIFVQSKCLLLGNKKLVYVAVVEAYEFSSLNKMVDQLDEEKTYLAYEEHGINLDQLDNLITKLKVCKAMNSKKLTDLLKTEIEIEYTTNKTAIVDMLFNNLFWKEVDQVFAEFVSEFTFLLLKHFSSKETKDTEKMQRVLFVSDKEFLQSNELFQLAESSSDVLFVKALLLETFDNKLLYYSLLVSKAQTEESFLLAFLDCFRTNNIEEVIELVSFLASTDNSFFETPGRVVYSALLDMLTVFSDINRNSITFFENSRFLTDLYAIFAKNEDASPKLFLQMVSFVSNRTFSLEKDTFYKMVEFLNRFLNSKVFKPNLLLLKDECKEKEESAFLTNFVNKLFAFFAAFPCPDHTIEAETETGLPFILSIAVFSSSPTSNNEARETVTKNFQNLLQIAKEKDALTKRVVSISLQSFYRLVLTLVFDFLETNTDINSTMTILMEAIDDLWLLDKNRLAFFVATRLTFPPTKLLSVAHSSKYFLTTQLFLHKLVKTCESDLKNLRMCSFSLGDFLLAMGVDAKERNAFIKAVASILLEESNECNFVFANAVVKELALFEDNLKDNSFLSSLLLCCRMKSVGKATKLLRKFPKSGQEQKWELGLQNTFKNIFRLCVCLLHIAFGKTLSLWLVLMQTFAKEFPECKDEAQFLLQRVVDNFSVNEIFDELSKSENKDFVQNFESHIFEKAVAQEQALEFSSDLSKRVVKKSMTELDRLLRKGHFVKSNRYGK